MLKVLRNAIADSLAAVAYQIPPAEPLLRAAGRAIEPLPGVGTLYRRSVDTLLRRLAANHKQFRRLEIGDVSFLFDVSDFTSRPWVFHRRLFEPETTRFLLDYLKPGQTVLDIGANRGYITLIAAQRVGRHGRVHSVEPNRRVLADLRRHVEMNQLSDRVTLCSDAFSNCSDQNVTFYVSTLESNTGLSSLTPSVELLKSRTLSHDHTVTVRTNMIDEYVHQERISMPIDLIKIDVEGAELAVLEGAERTLRESPPRCWIVETEPDSEACRLLISYGYRERRLDTTGDKINAVYTLSSLV